MPGSDLPHHHKLETAGRLAIRHVPVLPETGTVATSRRSLQSDGYEAIDLIILTDSSGRYSGALELRQLVEGSDGSTLKSLARTGWPTVLPAMDQEHAVELALRHGVTVLPVVGPDHRPIGLFPAHILLDVLGREHREDVDRVAGILRERAGARHALEDPPLKRVARRLPWLLAGLALSTAATGVMANFESTLQSNVMIAFFIPALVYLTDAVGTQTEAIAVRGLSARDKPLVSLLASELMTGALIGAVLGLIAFAAVWLVYGNSAVATGVGISLFAAATIASGIGLVFPWTLARFGVDPAFGAGPVATIFQDVLTILIYFVVMTRLIGMGG